MCFISMIRLPDFVTKKDFDWAVTEAAKKKKMDFSKVEFLTYSEGLCVQCMHIGSYDEEPATVQAMHEFAERNGCKVDITDRRFHHEIYLSDPRKCAPENARRLCVFPSPNRTYFHKLAHRAVFSSGGAILAIYTPHRRPTAATHGGQQTGVGA